MHNKKVEIDLSIYLNCAISLFRAINDSHVFLSEDMIIESFAVLNSLEEFIQRKVQSNLIFTFILNNLKFILDSLWDISKPKSTSLYSEQKDIISLVTTNLNSKKLIFFEMPPANGKTVLSAILAKIIAYTNKQNISTIPGYKRKTLLYICYNTIVRNEVAKLCITHNVDCKYWLAVTKQDKEDQKIKTFLRPYQNCYPDWNRKGLRTKKDQEVYDSKKYMKFSENIHEQWKFFINETKPVSEQIKQYTIEYDDKKKMIVTDIEYDYENADNIPEMIISDLDSAYTLLKEFPDTFVTYFDEAFAAAELEITSKIMSVMGHTILVSATLAQPEEIPTVITKFKNRHGHQDDSFLHRIKSNKQHISCTFIDSQGYLFAPHNNVSDLESLKTFIPLLEIPLIRRAYSPEVVFNISTVIDIHLPEELKFKTVFQYLGSLTHDSLRDYACNILKFINGTEDNALFQVLKSLNNKIIRNMELNAMFTHNAIHYHDNKTLHVASSNNFDNHVENISELFLKDSPRLDDMFKIYEKEYDFLKNELDSLNKTVNKIDKTKANKDDRDLEYKKTQIENKISNLKFKWPREFILNSAEHANKFKHYSKSVAYNTNICGTKEELDVLDDTSAKLFLSGIGVYQPEDFSASKMDLFLRNKDDFKFILSTPSIVYGTNISLSMIDIDSSFVGDSTKNRLYQVIGRAGRKGKSSSATIIFRDMRLLDTILEQDTVNIEAVQIEHNFQKYI